jgi:polygalacturonase
MSKLIFTIVLLIIGFTHSLAATCNILDFGAKENQLSTVAIQKAVDRCFENGGGTVLVQVENG